MVGLERLSLFVPGTAGSAAAAAAAPKQLSANFGCILKINISKKNG